MRVIDERFSTFRQGLSGLFIAGLAALALAAPASAQDLEKVDPDAAMTDQGIDADLATPAPPAPAPVDPTATWSEAPAATGEIAPAPGVEAAPSVTPAAAAASAPRCSTMRGTAAAFSAAGSTAAGAR